MAKGTLFVCLCLWWTVWIVSEQYLINQPLDGWARPLAPFVSQHLRANLFIGQFCSYSLRKALERDWLLFWLDKLCILSIYIELYRALWFISVSDDASLHFAIIELSGDLWWNQMRYIHNVAWLNNGLYLICQWMMIYLWMARILRTYSWPYDRLCGIECASVVAIKRSGFLFPMAPLCSCCSFFFLCRHSLIELRWREQVSEWSHP